MKIYLAHALTGASEGFRQRMLALRKELNLIPNVEVLEFNWIPGVGPDKTKNTYKHDMDNVIQADLMIGVLDHPSIGLGMEIAQRCNTDSPMFLFHPAGSRVSQIVPDCIAWHRRLIPTDHRDVPTGLYDLVAYSSDDELVERILKWMKEEGKSIYDAVG